MAQDARSGGGGEASALEVRLDRRSDVPLGTQLVWQLRALIGSGRLAPGDRLPGVRDMAELAGVNVNTVRSVYTRMADQGLIVSEHGRGTFVAPRLPDGDDLARIAEEVAATARDAGIDPRDLAAALFAAPAEAAAARQSPADAAGARDAAGAAQPFAGEARRRAALRADIAQLERQLAALELPGEAAEPGSADAPRPRPTPQLLTAAELESIRDGLADRLAALRADRTVARREREVVLTEPAEPAAEPRRNRGIATSAPKIVSGAGSWTLRWPRG